MAESMGLLETLLASMERLRDTLRMQQDIIDRLTKRIEALEATEEEPSA